MIIPFWIFKLHLKENNKSIILMIIIIILITNAIFTIPVILDDFHEHNDN